MLRFVRQGKIPFAPLFIFIEKNRHESFKNKKGNWRTMMKEITEASFNMILFT